MITSTPLFTADVDEPYSYAVEATDPEGGTLQFEFSTSTTVPDGLSIDADTGVLSWTPTADQIGEHAVAILVRDDSGAVASQAFTIDVRENLPPEITSSPVTSVTAGSTYRYSIRATDPESGELTYSLTEGPDSLSIDRFGRIVWQTAPGAADPVSVTVRVTDEGGKFDEQSFEITFVADTEAPAVDVFRSLSDFSLQSGGQIDIGSTALIRVIASDNVAVETLSLEVNGTPVALDLSLIHISEPTRPY